MQTKKLSNLIGWIIIIATIFVFIIVISKFFSEVARLEFEGFRIEGLEPGSEAPDFTLKNLTGNKIKLSEFKGKKNVILYFWSTWCAPCKEISSLLNKFRNKHKEEVEILAINMYDSASSVRKYIKRHNYDFITLLDEKNEVQRLYKVFGPPTLVVINKKGKIRSVHIGYKRDILKELEEELESPYEYQKKNKVSLPDIKSTDGLHRQGKKYMEEGEYEKAITCFEKLAKEKSHHKCVYEYLAYLYPKVGKIDKAILACKKDLEISPKDIRTIGKLGYLYSLSGNYNESVKMYKKLVKLTPKCAAARYHLGWAYINIGEVDLAINELEKAVELNPKDFQTYILLGKTYNNIGEVEKAIKMLNKAKVINPNYSTTFYELGFVYESIGDKEKALNYYNKALSINKYDMYAKLGLQRLK